MQLVPEFETDTQRGADSAPDSSPAKNGNHSFPEGFLWGVATSHFQIEGNPHEIDSRSSDWSEWVVQDGRISDSSTADKACDFFSRYEEDIDLCRNLNLNSFRLSLNWPALCPTKEGGFAEPSRKFYRELLESLKKRGFKTFVTLFHFCLPSWVAEKGGWTNPDTIDEFVRFTEMAVKEFGDVVDFWLTVNEPLAYAHQGYIDGSWPPGQKGEHLQAFIAIRNMLSAHAGAYHKIHEIQPDAKVSYTFHWIPFIPRNRLNPLDHYVAHMRNQVFNHVWMRAVDTGVYDFPWPVSLHPKVKAISGKIEGLAGTSDYIGVNYYTRQICQFRWGWPLDIFGVRSEIAELETSDLGWEIYPFGLYDLLTRGIAPYANDKHGKPLDIYITENGLAYNHSADLSEGDWSLDDDLRVRYLVAHLMAVHKALKAGVNVKGYLHWSLLDNFEWAEGLRARFGLVRVSYPTLERALRRSARIYAAIAASNSIVAGA